ncbi:baseplate J/gp47 family protein [bacterium]|nr:baseplate J/gp47 family protein [bacterium]
MSLDTPTTQELSDNIVAQLEASLNQTIPLLPKAFLRVLAKTLAGVFILLYKYGGFMFQQLFVRTASTSATVVNGVSIVPLVEWGRQIGAGDPAAAVPAELSVQVTVENQTGSLPASTQLVGPDNGVTYVTLASVLLDSATKTVTVKAVADQAGGGGAGAVGNLDPGAVVSFANPLANVSRNAVVLSQTVTGADGESWANYRQRVLDRFQKRPQGGAYADYEGWGEEPAGIVNVYPYTSDCPGQVDVYAEATPASSGSPDGIPTTAQLQAVLDSIELDDGGLASRRPANGLANAFPITRTAFVVTVTALEVTDLAQVQADVTAAVQEYFLGRGPYIPGLSVPPRTDRITVPGVDGVVDDIVSAAGGIFGGSVITLASVPVVAYSLGIGEKAKASVVFT